MKTRVERLTMKKHTTSSIYSVLVAANFAAVEADSVFAFDANGTDGVFNEFSK